MRNLYIVNRHDEYLVLAESEEEANNIVLEWQVPETSPVLHVGTCIDGAYETLNANDAPVQAKKDGFDTTYETILSRAVDALISAGFDYNLIVVLGDKLMNTPLAELEHFLGR